MLNKSVVVIAGLVAFSVHAGGFGLGQTRVILTQDSGVASVTAINGSEDTPYLVKGLLSEQRNKRASVPAFLLSPPLFRLEPGGKNVVRIKQLSTAGLPGDRESVFYLNMMAIPGSKNPLSRNRNATNGVSAGMSVGVGMSIKLFYRPSALSSPTVGTYKTMTVSRVPGGISIMNPSPYYINFASLQVDGRRVTFSPTQPEMLAPFGHQFYGTRSVKKQQVQWDVINDFGGTEHYQAAIQ